MKKILVIGLSNNIGGMETFFHTYYRYFDKKKYSFDFATVTNTVAFGDEYEKNGSRIFRLPSFLKNPIGYSKELRKIINDGKYDVIHINMLSAANILPIVSARKEKVERIIIHSHNYGTPSGLLRKVLDKVNKGYIKRCNAVKVACSRKAGEWLFGKNGDFKVVANAIELKRFHFDEKDRARVRRELGLDDDDFLMGNVGRLCEQKNQVFLVELLAMLDKSTKLIVVGDGEKKEELEKKARRLKVEKQLMLVPNNDFVEQYYSAMDLFVFPSIFEGLGIVLIEAQANGLKCICSEAIQDEANVGGVKKILLDYDKWAKEINDLKSKKIRYNYNMEKYDILKQYKKWSFYD